MHVTREPHHHPVEMYASAVMALAHLYAYVIIGLRILILRKLTK